MDTIQKDNLTGRNNGNLFPNSPLKYLTATSIIGDKVYNRQEEELGEIKDVMLDIRAGKIDYVVIEFGGFLGLGVKYFAIPFHLLRIDEEKQRFLFDQSKETLSRAPGFDMDHWPDTNLHLEEAYTYWRFI